jgi:hypothetical protein
MRAQLDEAAARADLAEHGKRSIRALAAAWGWHRSRVSRFLTRLDGETPSLSRETPALSRRETPSFESETPALSRDLEGETEEVAETPKGQGYLTMGPALKAMIAGGGENWRPDNADIVTAGSPALAVYANEWGQIVLCCDCYMAPGAMGGSAEAYIVINPRDVDAVIGRLRQLADELLGQVPQAGHP